MKKYITIIAALVVLAGAFLIARSLMNNKKAPPPSIGKVTPLALVQNVKTASMPLIIPASGSLTARHRKKLFSEVQGVLEVENKEFKPGVKFKKGEIIYKLNSEEFYTNLLSQKSAFQNQIVSILPDVRLDFPDAFQQWQDYLDKIDITLPLPQLPQPKTDQEKRFVSAKNVYTNFYAIKNMEIKLDKYTIYAPYDGVLTEANLTPGTLVSPGQLIGEFINTSEYEMEVSINSALASKLNIGDDVTVQNLENDDMFYQGKILRINEKVDLTSQTINLFILLSGDGLKEGLYLRAFLKSQEFDNLVEIPRNLLVNENKVFTLNDSTLNLADIELVHQNEQTIFVRGLSDGQVILAKPVAKAFNGMKVLPKFQSN